MTQRLFLSERWMLLAVALNSILIYVMYFPALRDVKLLEYIDIGFILWFCIEAAVKMKHYGVSGYFHNNWNRFDFMIVVLSLPTLLVPFIDVPNTGFFIVLRLFRLVRIARVLRFFPDVHRIFVGLARAMRASVLMFTALVFLLFVFSIVTCHFYHDLVPEYFGDPLVSLYSVFQMFTVEGWYEIPAAIAEKTDNTWVIGITRLYFGLMVLLGGVFGMSMVNAVFVDEMTMDNTDELEDKVDELSKQITEIKELLQSRS